MSLVTIFSVLAIIASVFFAVYLRPKKPVEVAKEKIIHFLKADINYKVSFMTKDEDSYYSVINISITNNFDFDLEDVGISCYPFCPIIPDITISNPDKVTNVSLLHLHYESFTNEPVNVPAGGLVSGYLIFQSPSDLCPIDELKITGHEQEVIVKVHKELIVEETIANRHF